MILELSGASCHKTQRPGLVGRATELGVDWINSNDIKVGCVPARKRMMHAHACDTHDASAPNAEFFNPRFG